MIVQAKKEKEQGNVLKENKGCKPLEQMLLGSGHQTGDTSGSG